MEISWGRALQRNFLSQFPDWYKLALIIFLIINPLIPLISPFVAGWLLVAELTFTLVMTLKCCLLLPGGLLAIEAVLIGITSVKHVCEKVAASLEVLLLLIFMMAGIYSVKQLLLFMLTRLLLSVHSKILLSLSFCVAAAFLSTFLDALAVVAVVISVTVGFYSIYHHVASSHTEDINLRDDSYIGERCKVVLEQFYGFLCSLMMHAGVGTTLGGAMTMAGKSQSPVITKATGWHFGDLFLRVSSVIVLVLICNLLTCLLVEKLRWLDYDETLPEKVCEVLRQLDDQSRNQRTRQDKIRLIAQAIIDVWLVITLALHLTEVGLIGLSVIILTISLTGVTDERAIGKAFTESLPFTTLLTVPFSVVVVTIDQQLFSPIIRFMLQASEHAQLSLFYVFNGPLSSISDNVFVGTIYINEAKAAMESGAIALKQYELLAVTINTGTNLPFIATPSGRAAFLFLLTSALAPLIRLFYSHMVWMTLPCTLTLAFVGLFCVEFTFAPVTEWFMQVGWVATL